MYILTNGKLITRDPAAKGYYEHGAVVFEGTKIVEVGDAAALANRTYFETRFWGQKKEKQG